MTYPLSRAALAAFLACVLPEGLLAQAPTDIGTLPDFTASRPKNISNRGAIVGQAARVGPEEQAALWTRTRGRYVVEALPSLDGLTRSDARAFARGAAPVGFSSLLTVSGEVVSRAVVWRDDPSGLRVAVDLEPPPGFTDAQAFDANRSGLIVGEASNPRELIGGSTVRHAVAWQSRCDGDYEVLDLGVPDGFDVSSASGVNEAGEIVGTARRLEADGSQTAAVVVWRRPHKRHGRCHSETYVLASHPDLPRNQNPAISTTGLVVAQADRITPGQPTTSRPLYWRRCGRGFSEPRELPLPAGFTDGFATDVNSLGVILGTAQVRQATAPTLAYSAAVVWLCGHRGDFKTRLLANPAGVAVVNASRLNERGDVVGIAPNPAPGTTGGLVWKRATWSRWFPAQRGFEMQGSSR
jgi:hypothetical protein